MRNKIKEHRKYYIRCLGCKQDYTVDRNDIDDGDEMCSYCKRNGLYNIRDIGLIKVTINIDQIMYGDLCDFNHKKIKHININELLLKTKV